MKSLAAFVFILGLISCNKQDKTDQNPNAIKDRAILYGSEKHVAFDLTYATDTTSVDGIDWKKEKLTSEFILKGKKNLTYALHIKNDTVAELSGYHDGKWEFQERINISEWIISRVQDKMIISDFEIYDFDRDGNEDLICWVNTNINGNRWTVIFLNDPKTNKLKKLYSADGTDIWDGPLYDTKTKIISCELLSGVFGFQSTYTHKLIQHKAIPLNKEERDYTSIDP